MNAGPGTKDRLLSVDEIFVGAGGGFFFLFFAFCDGGVIVNCFIDWLFEPFSDFLYLR